MAAEKSKNFETYQVYIIKLYDIETNEIFFKIGKTFTKLNKRFKNIPYKKDIIRVHEFTCAMECSKFETNLKKEHKQFSYLPLKVFQGRQECFSELKTLDNEQ